ncbi:hypothetical protein PR048_025752 [Dryococelus australis]|uniref:HAT C-terminal dimerisation domain-containing protein n=1 Tax=Dryococelus australis TaxID=614101 RepID=A0ABQ9GJF4_9NEOP|nr:hypothetical protein PR048_025752 [Dryococelus australis]
MAASCFRCWFQRAKTRLATDPFHADIDSLPETLQEQALEIKNYSAVKYDFDKIEKTLFWVKYFKVYPDIAEQALQLYLTFSSTNLRERAFSAIVAIKTKYRSKLDIARDEHFTIVQSNHVQSSKERSDLHLCSNHWRTDACSRIYITVKFSLMPNNNANFAVPRLPAASTPLPSVWNAGFLTKLLHMPPAVCLPMTIHHTPDEDRMKNASVTVESARGTTQHYEHTARQFGALHKEIEASLCREHSRTFYMSTFTSVFAPRRLPCVREAVSATDKVALSVPWLVTRNRYISFDTKSSVLEHWSRILSRTYSPTPGLIASRRGPPPTQHHARIVIVYAIVRDRDLASSASALSLLPGNGYSWSKGAWQMVTWSLQYAGGVATFNEKLADMSILKYMTRTSSFVKCFYSLYEWGRSRICACADRARRCHWSEGFPQESRVSPALAFQRWSILTSRFALIGSQDLDVKSCSNLFTRSLIPDHLLQKCRYCAVMSHICDEQDMMKTAKRTSQCVLPCYPWTAFTLLISRGGTISERAREFLPSQKLTSISTKITFDFSPFFQRQPPVSRPSPNVCRKMLKLPLFSEKVKMSRILSEKVSVPKNSLTFVVSRNWRPSYTEPGKIVSHGPQRSIASQRKRINKQLEKTIQNTKVSEVKKFWPHGTRQLNESHRKGIYVAENKGLSGTMTAMVAMDTPRKRKGLNGRAQQTSAKREGTGEICATIAEGKCTYSFNWIGAEESRDRVNCVPTFAVRNDLMHQVFERWQACVIHPTWVSSFLLVNSLARRVVGHVQPITGASRRSLCHGDREYDSYMELFPYIITNFTGRMPPSAPVKIYAGGGSDFFLTLPYMLNFSILRARAGFLWQPAARHLYEKTSSHSAGSVIQSVAILHGFINASWSPYNGGLMHVSVLMEGILNISFSGGDKLLHTCNYFVAAGCGRAAIAGH